MRVEELMSEAQGCEQGTSVRECAKLMKEQNIGFVPIIDAARQPMGTVTDRDLTIRVLAEGRSADEAVEQFASSGLVSCRMGDDVREAERLMRERRVSRVMVCDEDGKLQGIISLADIVDATSDEAAGETLQQVKSDEPPSAQH
jgi:signal-transduction protein with cAMP-binding, CBS, and nucleotidyltransferase domain